MLEFVENEIKMSSYGNSMDFGQPLGKYDWGELNGIKCIIKLK